MTTMQSFIRKLSPVGIYNIVQDSNIYAELSAYAYALDKLKSETDAVLRECFISTAEDYGLEIREKVFGNTRGSYPIESRREMLRLRRGFGDNDFTAEGFGKFMRSLGAPDYNLLESYSDYTVSVTLNDTLSDIDAKWVENQVKLIMPAHLITYVYNGGADFASVDSDNLTYSEFDNRNYTWRQLDRL